MRSSAKVDKGCSLLMRPIPEDWKGEKYTADQIRECSETIEASVTRTEGRGVFQVRLFTFDEQDIVNRIRTGQMREDCMKVVTVDAGMVTTLKIEGGVSMESAARMQRILRDLPKNRNLILLDMTQLSYFGSNGVAMLYMVLKDQLDKRNICILVKPDSRIQDLLNKSKIESVSSIFDNRESAVMALLQTQFE